MKKLPTQPSYSAIPEESLIEKPISRPKSSHRVKSNPMVTKKELKRPLSPRPVAESLFPSPEKKKVVSPRNITSTEKKPKKIRKKINK